MAADLSAEAGRAAKADAPGKRLWFVPDAYLPPPKPAEPLVNHEAVCLLNASKRDAHVTLTVYFEDREAIRVAAPGGGYFLGGTTELHNALPAENVAAFIDSAEEFGRYPLSLE